MFFKLVRENKALVRKLQNKERPMSPQSHLFSHQVDLGELQNKLGKLEERGQQFEKVEIQLTQAQVY